MLKRGNKMIFAKHKDPSGAPLSGTKIPAETERCVLCGTDTGIQKTVPVGIRHFYVSGAGQLCEHCYRETYERT